MVIPQILIAVEDCVFFLQISMSVPSHHIKIRTAGPDLQLLGRLEPSHTYCFVTDTPIMGLENGSQVLIICLQC